MKKRYNAITYRRENNVEWIQIKELFYKRKADREVNFVPADGDSEVGKEGSTRKQSKNNREWRKQIGYYLKNKQKLKREKSNVKKSRDEGMIEKSNRKIKKQKKKNRKKGN